MGGRRGEFCCDRNPAGLVNSPRLEAYLDLKCGLGVAPYYEEASHSLRFGDINKKKMHTVDLNQGPSSLQTFNLEIAVRLD